MAQPTLEGRARLRGLIRPGVAGTVGLAMLSLVAVAAAKAPPGQATPAKLQAYYRHHHPATTTTVKATTTTTKPPTTTTTAAPTTTTTSPPTTTTTDPPTTTTTSPPTTTTTTTPAIVPLGVAGSWHLVENDQFAGASSLPSDVHPNLAWGGSSAKGYGVETFTPGQVSLGSDGVHLNGNPSNNLSGALSTAAQSGGTAGFYLQPGKDNYVEARIELPGGNGWWPAFWLLSGGDGNWPWPPEIDIFEGGLGGAGTSLDLEGHFHQTNSSQTGYNLGSVDTGWHTYGFRLNSSEAVWYIDGKQVASTTNTTNIADEFSKGGLYVVFDLAMGGTAGNPPTAPGSMVISYLRGWTQ